MTLNIPTSKREVFNKHLVNQCFCRLDFEDLFDVSDLAKEAIQILSKDFPNRKKANTIDVFKMGESSEINEIPTESVFMFYDDQQNQIKIGNRFIVLDFRSYSNFDYLCEVFSSLFEFLNNHFLNNRYTRLGLRKINIIDAEELDSLQNFEDALTPYFTTHLNQSIIDNSLREDIHKLLLSDKFNNTDMEVILQYGTRKGFINEKTTRRFILDIDYSTKSIKCDSIVSQLKDLNQRIFDVFFWAVTDKLKEELRK